MTVGVWISRTRFGSLALSFVCAFAVIGCASSGGASDGGSRDVITRAEIAESNLMTAYEVVRQLRPAFLQRRRARSIETGDAATDPVVYLDGVPWGGPQELNQIDAQNVEEIRYLDATDATMRFGTGHSAGAILVTTRAG